jgi:hypothetical protein
VRCISFLSENVVSMASSPTRPPHRISDFCNEDCEAGLHGLPGKVRRPEANPDRLSARRTIEIGSLDVLGVLQCASMRVGKVRLHDRCCALHHNTIFCITSPLRHCRHSSKSAPITFVDLTRSHSLHRKTEHRAPSLCWRQCW